MALLRCGGGSANAIEFITSVAQATVTITNALDYANIIAVGSTGTQHDSSQTPITFTVTGGTSGTVNEDISDTSIAKYCASAIITPSADELTISHRGGTYPMIILYGVKK